MINRKQNRHDSLVSCWHNNRLASYRNRSIDSVVCWTDAKSWQMINQTDIPNFKLCTRLTHARAAFTVQIIEATETFFAAWTIYQVALARLCNHALGDDRRAHSFIAGVTYVCKRQQWSDDGDKKYVLHLAMDDS